MTFDSSGFVADPELVNELEKRATPVECETDRVLFNQGDPAVGLYLLKAGEATLTMNADVEEPLFKVVTGPGSLLGLPGVIGSQPYSLTAVARKGSHVGFISQVAFTSLMQAHPQLSLKILQVLAAEVRTARQALY